MPSHIKAIKEFENTKSTKQKVWEYIRRNKSFSVWDLLVVFEAKLSYIKWLLWFFADKKAIKLSQNSKKFQDRIYQLNKDLGIKAP